MRLWLYGEVEVEVDAQGSFGCAYLVVNIPVALAQNFLGAAPKFVYFEEATSAQNNFTITKNSIHNDTQSTDIYLLLVANKLNKQESSKLPTNRRHGSDALQETQVH